MNKNTILLTSIMAICTVLFVPTASIFADGHCSGADGAPPYITSLSATDTTITVTWIEAYECDAQDNAVSPDSTNVLLELGVDLIDTRVNIHGDGNVTFEDLTPEETYNITIEAIYSGGAYITTTEGETTTQAAPPRCVDVDSLITNLIPTDTTARITWIEATSCASDGETSYPDSTRIYIAEIGGDHDDSREGITSDGDVTFDGLTPDTTYYIAIEAKFEGFSFVTEGTITTESAPCEDVKPFITALTSTDTTARIVWDDAILCVEDGTASPSSTTVTLTLDGDEVGKIKIINGDGVADFDGLVQDTTYDVEIDAEFIIARSSTSHLITEGTITTQTATDDCVEVYSLITDETASTDTTVNVAWTEAVACDEDGEIYPDSTSVTLESEGYKKTYTGFEGDSDAEFVDLTPDTTYAITIRAIFDGHDALTTEGTITTQSAPNICVPRGPLITTNTSTDTTLTVAWNEGTGCSDGIPIPPDSTTISIGFRGEIVEKIEGITGDGDVHLEGLTPDTTYDIEIVTIFKDSEMNTTTVFIIRTLVEAETIEDETIEDETGKGSNEHHTRPTFGIDHETFTQLVDGGFTFNDNSFDVIHNFWTPFPIQTIKIGEVNTFSAKVYADKGLNVQEFLFGIPVVGEAHKAELGIEVFYDNLGEITLINVVQKSEVIDTSTLVVTHDQVKCTMLDIQSRCHVTYLEMVFLEPLFDDVMALKATDFKARSQITYLNDGFDISGDSLNPMITREIAGPEKYEGVIEVAQTAKYSNIWESNDGRLFESNESYSFEWINQTFERTIDDGTMRDRMHSGFASLKQSQADKAIETLLSICPKCLESFTDFDDSFSYTIPEPTDRLNSSSVQEKMSAENEKAQKIMYTILNPIQQ